MDGSPMTLREWQTMKSSEWDLLAKWYDLMCPRDQDLSFYRALAEEQKGPILELGCGTGRVACEMASAGFQVVAIDISGGQLGHARLRRARLPASVRARLEFRQLSATDFTIPERFRLIMACFSTVFELGGAEARIAAYKRCREHLEPDGVFALDNSVQGAGAEASWGNNRPEGALMFVNSFPHPDDSSSLVQHFQAQQYGTAGRMELTVFLDTIAPSGHLSRSTFRISRHYATPAETTSELRAAGFGSIELFGGFGREPFLDPTLQGKGRQVFIAHE